MGGIPALWLVAEPTEWPATPVWMTCSRLLDIETCPRRWALVSARYPHVWDHAGYPDRPNINAIIGSIAHLALKRVIEAIAYAGCSSVRDSRAPDVLRGMGGLSKIVQSSASDILGPISVNPRAERIFDFLSRTVQSKLGEVREKLQLFLTRIELPGSQDSRTDGGPSDRKALGVGTYAEIELEWIELGWRGVVDLMHISQTGCEIVDFKTGKFDEHHRLQLLVYGVLWRHDVQRNPKNRPITKLTISYPASDVTVPAPADAEINQVERDIVARTKSAINSIRAVPPEARPAIEACNYCEVRQLCSDYWVPGTQKQLSRARADSPSPDDSPFSDLEVVIRDRHGSLSYDAIVTVSGLLEEGQPILLRLRSPGVDVQVGDRLRLLDAVISENGTSRSEPRIVSLPATSELFVVPRRP